MNIHELYSAFLSHRATPSHHNHFHRGWPWWHHRAAGMMPKSKTFMGGSWVDQVDQVDGRNKRWKQKGGKTYGT